MKFIISILFLVASLNSGGAIIYLSPSGSDGNPGTIGSPKFSLEGAWAVVSAGDTIYMRGGDYQYTTQQDLNGKNGTAGNLIKVWAYPGETPNVHGGLFVFDIDTDQDLISFTGDYVHWKGIEISYLEQQVDQSNWFAFRSGGMNNCIFEQINYHHNGAAFTVRGDGTGNLFLNCDFHHNQDPYSDTPYDGADGFALTYNTNTSAVNTVRGCRAWWNADDGFDFWENRGTVNIDSCWSFWNGYIPGTFSTAGNGSGFKLGQGVGTSTSVRRVVTRCIASSNRNWGFVENNTLYNMQIYNNTAAHNGTLNWWFGDWGASPKTFTNNLSLGGGCLYDDCENLYSQVIGADATLTTNSWQGFTSTSADFQSTDSTQLIGARSNGTLPNITFLRLVSGSDMVNTGTEVGYGNDLGALQYILTNRGVPMIFFR